MSRDPCGPASHDDHEPPLGPRLRTPRRAAGDRPAHNPAHNPRPWSTDRPHGRSGTPGCGPAPRRSSRPKAMCANQLLAHVAVDKYLDHLPLFRQVQRFTREGLDLHRSTLSRWMMELGELLRPIVSVLAMEVLSGSWLRADATGMPVVDRSRTKGKAHHSHFWAYGNYDSVVFAYPPTKKANTVAALLEGFAHWQRARREARLARREPATPEEAPPASRPAGRARRLQIGHTPARSPGTLRRHRQPPLRPVFSHCEAALKTRLRNHQRPLNLRCQRHQAIRSRPAGRALLPPQGPEQRQVRPTQRGVQPRPARPGLPGPPARAAQLPGSAGPRPDPSSTPAASPAPEGPARVGSQPPATGPSPSATQRARTCSRSRPASWSSHAWTWCPRAGSLQACRTCACPRRSTRSALPGPDPGTPPTSHAGGRVSSWPITSGTKTTPTEATTAPTQRSPWAWSRPIHRPTSRSAPRTATGCCGFVSLTYRVSRGAALPAEFRSDASQDGYVLTQVAAHHRHVVSGVASTGTTAGARHDPVLPRRDL